MTTSGDHVKAGLVSTPNTAALCSERRSHPWSSRDIQKRRPQALQRQLEDRESVRMAWSFSGTLPQSLSIFTLPTPRPPCHACHLAQIQVSHNPQPHRNTAPLVQPIPAHISRPQKPAFPQSAGYHPGQAPLHVFLRCAGEIAQFAEIAAEMWWRPSPMMVLRINIC